MPRQYGNELDQSFLGDLILDSSGDIKTTALPENAMENIAINRVKAVSGDWGYSSFGANLMTFIGQQNTRENADKIKKNIIFALTADGLISRTALNVRIVPVTKDSVSIFISVNSVDIMDPVIFSYKNGFDMVVA